MHTSLHITEDKKKDFYDYDSTKQVLQLYNW